MRLYRRWVGIAGTASGSVKTIGGSFHTYFQLDRTRENLKRNYNLYIGLNATACFAGIRVSRDDITLVENILLDIDGVLPDPEGDMVHRLAVTNMLDRIPGVPNDPNYTFIYSGRGWQVLLPVTQSPLLTPELRSTWESAVRAFLVAAAPYTPPPGRLDLACSDLSRIYRMPDTTNFKTGNRAYVVYKEEGGNCINFNNFIAEFASQTFFEPLCEVAHPRDWWKEVSNFPVTARRYLTEEVPIGERNHDAFVAAISLREIGLTKSFVRSILVNYNHFKQHPLPKAELLGVIDNAYRKRLGTLRVPEGANYAAV